MGFGERAAQRRKSKDLKAELKQLKKELLSTGVDKTFVNTAIKELGDALELGDTLQADYETAKSHLEAARAGIAGLLDCMAEKSESEVQAELSDIIKELELIYHDCSIRADDQDYQSTLTSLKQMLKEMSGNTGSGRGAAASASKTAGAASGMASIMLRSEMENVMAVLDDASGWRAPEFFSLAYYYLHEDKDTLKEIENEQRNAQVSVYTKEHFLEGLLRECGKAGNAARVQELIQTYIYE